MDPGLRVVTPGRAAGPQGHDRIEASRVAGSAVAEPSCPEGVPDEVWAYVLRFYPRSLTPDVWEQVRPFVLDITGQMTPLTQEVASKVMSDLTALWGWAAARHLPLDPEKVLTPDRVARYVEETFVGRPIGSATTVRSRLERIGRATTRRAPWPGRPTVIPRTPPAGPYLPVEIAGYRRAAVVQRSRNARRCLTGVMVLCAGAGAMPGEAVRARTDGLVLDASGRWCVTLDRPGRIIPIVVDYVEDALRLAAEYPGEPWLSPRPRHADWLSDRLRVARLDSTLPPLLSARLRASWIVGRLDAGVPVKTLVRAAGFSTAHSLSPLLAFTTNDDDSTLALSPLLTPASRISR